MEFQFPLNVEVHCTDGHCGRSTHIILNPVTEQVSHLVVNPKQLSAVERYYGFLGGETNQWYPDLVYDNHFVEQPYSPEDGYHLDKDLAAKAIGFIADAKQIAPDKPFFMYYCPGTAHAPHHAPKEESVA